MESYILENKFLAKTQMDEHQQKDPKIYMEFPFQRPKGANNIESKRTKFGRLEFDLQIKSGRSRGYGSVGKVLVPKHEDLSSEPSTHVRSLMW